MNWRSFLKLELHLHLEGAAPAAFIRQLAHEKNTDLSGIFGPNGYDFQNFNHFLQIYESACSVLTGPEDFYRLTRAVMEECAAHGVIYVESFISPDFCGGCDLAAWRDYLAAIETANAEMAGVEMRAIATCIRHFGPEQARRSALCAAETASDFLVGFGMGGAELMHAPAEFAYAFDMAREAELRMTCHAGEWGGAEMVRATLDDLRVERIGHGIGAAEDPALVQRLVEEGVVLEVCPGSNVVLQAVPGWAAHPVEQLRRAGVQLTISTDDPPFFHTTMTAEYEALATHFQWDKPVFQQINAMALEAAFCDETTRAALRKQLEDAQCIPT